MDQKEIRDVVRELVAAPSCCQELKEAGRKWLEAVEPAAKKEAAAALVLELREDIAPIGHVVEFFESPRGRELFGEERAGAIAAHAREVMARGGKWCDCPACAAGLKILENAALLE